MLSGKLIHLIEAHQEQITARVLAQILEDPELTHIRSLPQMELREWGQHILENLGDWLVRAKEDELAHRYQELGRIRFDEGVPLYEAVRGLFLLKYKMIDFVKEQGLAKTSVDLYAEEEMELRVGRFFDLLAVYLVRGYEKALRRAAHLGATAVNHAAATS